MKKSRMKGVIDPITVAFVLSILETIAGLALYSGLSKQDQAKTVST